MITMHPGEFLREAYIGHNGMTASKIAAACGIDQARMSRLVNEKCDVTPLLAIKLEKGLGRSAESWLEMQHQHDLAQIREVRMIGEAVAAADRGEFASEQEVQEVKDKYIK
jgi:addiction module HigA family antidote